MLTWRCGICGEERPDEAISVMKHQLPGPARATRNVNYCNDRIDCAVAADAWPESEEGRRMRAIFENTERHEIPHVARVEHDRRGGST